MKKTTTLQLAGFIALIAIIGFSMASCGDGGSPHSHTFGTEWKSNATHHWHECECGEKDDIGNHDFSEWDQTKAPTFTEAGEKTEKCSVCGTLGTVTQEVPQLTPLASIEEITAYLETATGGATAADPIPLKLELDLGTMGLDPNNWTGLLDILNTEGKYVDLDLSGCTMTGTEFSTGATSSSTAEDTPVRMIASITIPDSVTSIGVRAFNNCTSLTSVIIPDGVTSIGDYAFNGCHNLTSVTIPDGVTSIDMGAFANCTGLTSVTIGNGVTSIGSGAFIGCRSLTSITIPIGVTTIGNGAFRGCTGLTSVTIPDSVTSIDNSAFDMCDNLASVTFERANTSFNQNSAPNGSFPNAASLRTAYTNGGIGEYTRDNTTVPIPDTVPWVKQ